MVDSITTALGVGSGIDIKALVDNLVTAQFQTKNQILDTRETAIKAQISTAGELKSAITGFSTALATLARGGTLSTQPTSGDPSVVKVSLLSGGSAAGLSATVVVDQIASAQASNSDLVSDTDKPFRAGTLTLTFGSATVAGGKMTGFEKGTGKTYSIGVAEGSKLADIAAAINKENSGVTASVIGDANGSRLVLKGQTGASQAFTLAASDDSIDDTADFTGLAKLQVTAAADDTPGRGNIGTAAQDAIVVVDGVQVQRASNSISNLLPGIRLDLVSAKKGAAVQLGSASSTEGLSQAVQDFVTTYNQLKTMLSQATDPKGGALRADPAARALSTQLAQLVGTQLTSGGTGPRTLAEFGVATQRDGTLRVDATRLSTALAANPQAAEAIFASGKGLPAALAKIATDASSAKTGLGASEARYNALASDLSEQRDQAVEAATQMRTRMTQQFASMDAKVAAYKSTESFLKQQVDAWNNSNN